MLYFCKLFSLNFLHVTFDDIIETQNWHLKTISNERGWCKAFIFWNESFAANTKNFIFKYFSFLKFFLPFSCHAPLSFETLIIFQLFSPFNNTFGLSLYSLLKIRKWSIQKTHTHNMIDSSKIAIACIYVIMYSSTRWKKSEKSCSSLHKYINFYMRM